MKTPPPTEPSNTGVEDGNEFHTDVNGIIAVLLLGAVGLFIWFFRPDWNFDFHSASFNPAILVPFFLGAFGLYYLTLSVRGNMRAKAFGLSTLVIYGPAVRMGETLKGAVRTSVELRPLGDYEIRLQCIETFVMRRNSASDSSRNVDRIRWEDTIRAVPASVKSMSGIPFEFTLPAPFEKAKTSNEKPEPSKFGPFEVSGLVSINIPGLQGVFAHNEAPISTRWVLEINAPLKGIDYYAIFGIIVAGSTYDRGTSVEVQLDSA